jgi:uncharacterized membrane protein
MLLLIVGLAVFIGVHVVTTMRDRRARLIERFGEGPYKIGYSVLSIVGLVLIVLGWRAAPFIPLWEPPVATLHIAIPLVWIAFVCVTAAYVPSGFIKARLRHPMLVGVKVWALAHLLANGDLAAMLLFGSLLAFAVYDRIAVKRRARIESAQPIAPPRWHNDLIAVAVGTVLFLGFAVYVHPHVIGVPVLPG